MDAMKHWHHQHTSNSWRWIKRSVVHKMNHLFYCNSFQKQYKKSTICTKLVHNSLEFQAFRQWYQLYFLINSERHVDWNHRLRWDLLTRIRDWDNSQKGMDVYIRPHQENHSRALESRKYLKWIKLENEWKKIVSILYFVQMVWRMSGTCKTSGNAGCGGERSSVPRIRESERTLEKIKLKNENVRDRSRRKSQ